MDPDSFPAKSVWQRMAIVFAGPAINFIFAIIVMAILFTLSGKPFSPAIVDQIREDGAAAAAGIELGDRIVAVDGEEVESFADLQAIVRVSAEQELAFSVERGGEIIQLPVIPELSEFEDRFGMTHRIGLIGVSTERVETIHLSPGQSLVAAFEETWRIISGTLVALGEMIVGSRGTEELGGPLKIAQMSGTIAADGLVPAIWFTAVLSINLGLINLFPIPMLDGGHLVLYTVEAIRGRAMTERTQEIAFRFGLAMVLSLMVFATWNDLVNLKVVEFVSGLVS
jgi:regulator of sigma E protease